MARSTFPFAIAVRQEVYPFSNPYFMAFEAPRYKSLSDPPFFASSVLALTKLCNHNLNTGFQLLAGLS
jgi:hypothetical protein